MHIPSVTDEMLDKVLPAAASPVVTIFVLTDDRPSATLAYLISKLAEEYDDRVIFLKISIDENPTISERLLLPFAPSPAVMLTKRGKRHAVLMGTMNGHEIRAGIEEVIEWRV